MSTAPPLHYHGPAPMTARGGVGILGDALQIGPVTFPLNQIAGVRAFTAGGKHWPSIAAAVILFVGLVAAARGGMLLSESHTLHVRFPGTAGPRVQEATVDAQSAIAALLLAGVFMAGAVFVYRLPHRTGTRYMVAVTATSGYTRYIRFTTAADLGAFRSQLEAALAASGVRVYVDARAVHFHR